MAEKDRQFRAREKEIRIKVTEAELQYVKDKASSCGLTVSELGRKMFMEGLVVKLETFDIKELSRELNKIGTNINQIARHVNEKGGEYDKQDMNNLIEEFKEMQSIIYSKALGME